VPSGVFSSLHSIKVSCTLGLDVGRGVTRETVFLYFAVRGDTLTTVRNGFGGLGEEGHVVLCLWVHGFVLAKHAAVHGADCC
jgi:hypothetical protein